MEASFDAIAIALTSARDCAGCERETALMLAADWEAELLRREAAWENRYAILAQRAADAEAVIAVQHADHLRTTSSLEQAACNAATPVLPSTNNALEQHASIEMRVADANAEAAALRDLARAIRCELANEKTDKAELQRQVDELQAHIKNQEVELAAATSETARVAQKLKVMYRINKSLGGGAAAEETAADHEDSKSRSESRKRKFSSSRHSARGPSKAEGNSSNSDTEGDVQNGDLSTNDETSPYKSRSSPQIDTSNPQAHTGTAGSTAPTKDDSTARYQYDARRDAEATDSVNAAMAESATFDAAVMLDTQDNLLAVGETQLLRQANQYGESLPPEIGNGTGLSTTSSVVDSTAMQLHHGPPPMTTTMTLTPDESDTAAGERNMNHAAEVPSPSGAVNSTSASDTSAVRLAISPCETATTATVPASKLRLSRQTPPPLESHAASNVPDSGSDSKNGGRSNANNNTKCTTHTSHAVPLNRFQRVVYRVKPAHLAATKSDSDGADFVDDSRSNSSSTLRSSSASGRSTNSNKCSTDEDIVGANSAESPLPRPSAAPSKKRQRRDKVPSGDALSDDGNGSSSKSSERGGARYFSRATDEKNTSDDVYHRFESSASPVKRADVNTSTRTTKMASSTGTEDANTEGQDRGRPIVVSKRAFVHDKDATAAAVPALPTARGIFVDDLDRGVHGDTATAAAAFASNDFDNPRASTDHDAGATIANAASAIDGVGAALVASEWQSRIPVGSQSKNSNNSGKRQSPPPIKGPGSIPSYFSSATKNVSAVKRGQSPPTKNDPAVARSTSSTAGAAEVGTHQGATASPAPGMYSYLEEFDQQASASAARAAAREALKAAEKAQKAPRKPPPTLPAYAATSHRDGSKIAHSSKPNDSRESSSSSSRNNQPTSAAKQQKEHRQLPHDRQLPGGGPPAYAYRDVVRKKCDREALPGHTCERCNHFVDGIIASGALSQSRRADFLGDCSRHKSTHKNAEVETPEEYWNLSFADSQEGRK